MRIVYLHGRMSSPNSQKCKVLRENGHEVFAPKLKSTDWAQSVAAAREIIEKVQPFLVIGSSRGGLNLPCVGKIRSMEHVSRQFRYFARQEGQNCQIFRFSAFIRSIRR